MLKTLTVLGAVSIISLSVLAETPAYAGSIDRPFVPADPVRGQICSHIGYFHFKECAENIGTRRQLRRHRRTGPVEPTGMGNPPLLGDLIVPAE